MGGVSLETGDVAIGIKNKKIHFGQPICAEDLVVEQLGGNIDDILMTPAARLRNYDVILVCDRCQTKYTIENFIEGTEFK